VRASVRLIPSDTKGTVLMATRIHRCLALHVTNGTVRFILGTKVLVAQFFDKKHLSDKFSVLPLSLLARS